MNYQELFEKNIQKIKNEERYRDFRVVKRDLNQYPVAQIKEKDIAIWCSNDYLGMSQNQEVIDAFIESAKKSGVGSGGTRNISGTSFEIDKLEKDIAKFHEKQDAIVFTSGYISNLATLSAITSIIPKIVIFSDSKNHASIISGIKHNRANKEIFKHNDIDDLVEKIKKYPIDTPKIIVFEGVYSMDASTPKILEIVEIAKKYNCLTYIDEVHAVGLYGKSGQGIASHFGVANEIDFIEGTFAKSFGVIGGYVTCNQIFKDAIRLNASSFIFTSSLPPAICSAISKSIEIIASKQGDLLREKHFKITDYIKDFFMENNINFLSDGAVNTHIIPLIINDAIRAKQISQRLEDEFEIYIQNINYPTVSKGKERLRITASPLHTIEMAKHLCESVKKCVYP